MLNRLNFPQQSLPMTILATSLGFVIVQVDVTIVNIALVEIGNKLNANISTLQWVIDAYALVFASLLMACGAIGDRLGYRRMFVWGFVIFSVASQACGVAQTAAQLIASRALQGVGAALIIPNSLALINHACAGNYLARARALGLWSIAGGVAAVGGPIVGGILVDLIGWRSIFLVNLPIGILGIWLTYRFVSNTQTLSQHRSIDLPGQMLAIIALLAMTSSVITAGAIGWTDWKVIAGISLALITCYAFMRVEANREHPMVPLELFRNSRFSAAITTGFLNNLAYYGLIFILSLFFQNTLHYSSLQTGLAFIPLAGATISNLIGSRIAAIKGPRLPMILGFLIATAGYGSLFGIDENISYRMMLFPLLLISFGLGLAIPPMTTALLSTVDQAHSGIASAVFTTMRQTGGAIGVAIFGTLVSGRIPASVSGIQTILIICAFLSLAAAGISAIWIGQHFDNSPLVNKKST